MKVSDYIANFFIEKNINHIFGYIGGFNADLLSSIKNKKINFILNHHEQASSFAANSYAIISESIGVAISSGAPSSCNMIAGIANAYFDSNPCIFIAGSSHSLGSGINPNIRQNLFEEIDMVNIVSKITKYATKVTNPNNIMYELEKAFYIANEGRKGPVLIDIPYDIARKEINLKDLKKFKPKYNKYDQIQNKEIFEIIKKSKKPLILVGGGMRSNQSRNKLLDLLKNIKIPVVASLCGLDVLQHNHDCYIGFIGHYGNRYANLALEYCDCLIVLGSRLDERQIGGYKTKLDENKTIIRVDIDKHELNRKFHEIISIYANVDLFLDELLKDDTKINFKNWLSTINKWKDRYKSYDNKLTNFTANNFIHEISKLIPANSIICADVGQNQMSTAQALMIKNNMKLINSAGYGSMGFSLPAAIGASYACNNNNLIISINGDGGFQMNIQELHTIKQNNLPITIVILNNKCLGMIKKTQEKLFNNSFFVSVDGYSVPNFEKIAYSYDIPYACVRQTKDITDIKEFIIKKSPKIIEVIFENNNIDTKPEPGNALTTQQPELSNDELETILNELKDLDE